MKMTRVFFAILFSIVTVSTFALEKELQISYDDSGVIAINKLKITSETTVKDLIKEIGEPSSKVEKGGRDEFFYEEIGIVIGIDNGIVKGIGINFNWDGDKKFPETSYTGVLNINGVIITKDSKNEDLNAIKGVSFECPMPMMCLSKHEVTGMKVMVGFNSEKALSQLIFMLK